MKSGKLLVTTVGLSIAFMTSIVANAADLKVFFSGGTEQYSAQIMAAYKKYRSGTRITPISTSQSNDFTMAVEKKPDVYVGFFAEMSNYADIGLFEDVAKLLGPQVTRDIPDGFLSAFAVGKRLLGIPVAGYTTGLHYNPELFTKAGLAAPEASWTWTGKFMEATRKLSRDVNGDGTREVYGIHGMTCNQFGQQGMPSPHFLSVVYGYGGEIVNKQFTKGMYTEKPAMDAIKFIIQLHKEKLADMTDYTYDPTDASTWPLIGGKTAMMLQMSATKGMPYAQQRWAQGKAPKFKPAVSIIPRGPKGVIPANMTQVASIMSTAKNKKEAVEFLKWLVGEKGQSILLETTGGLPTSTKGFSLKKAQSVLGSPMMKAYQNGRTWSARKGYLDIEFSLWGDIRNIVNGDSDMATLIENAKNNVPQILANSTYSWQ